MCGPTAQQTELGDEQIRAYQQAQQLTAQQYQNQQAIYAPMVQQFQSILDRGPGQAGFSPEEKSALDAETVEGTAENYRNASAAVGESLAAEGGGVAPTPTGSQQAIQAAVATSAAQEESKEQTGVETADYDQGYQEWLQAGQGLQSIAAGENPLGYEGAETGSGSAASSTEKDIAGEENSWVSAAIGAAGDIASSSKYVTG